MLKLELLEPIERPKGKEYVIIKYVAFNDKSNRSLIMRMNLYDNNATTTHVVDLKKNFISEEIEKYLGCSIESWKKLLIGLRDTHIKITEPYEAIINKICDTLKFKAPDWLKSEWLVARWLDGYMVDAGNAGYDVVDKTGMRYQVKTKELFKENREYGTRGTIEFKMKKSLDFDYLVVVGITETTKGVVSARMWSKEEVLEKIGTTRSFSLSNLSKFESGRKLL